MGSTPSAPIRSPDAGGLLGPDELGVAAVVAGFPFLREGRVVDFMAQTGRWYGQYAERVAAITGAYNEALVARAGDDLVPILVAHFMVTGVRVSHSERELHIGDAYTATAQAIPAGPQYVALGHIHAPQSVPGAAVPAEYAGSLLALDFGEAGETKRVVLVDVEPGTLATVRSVPITAGRPLVAARGTWDALAARAEELDRQLRRPDRGGGRPRSRARPSSGGAVPVPGSGSSQSARPPSGASGATPPTGHPTRISTRRSCARSPARNRPRTSSRSSTRCSRRQPMRPHELTLRGFRSYRDEVTFDFRGRHLVGIVGPIGAGKSSILDGIAFALFGKTPRVQKETKSLIHQLSDSAHVRLTFEVDGQTWQVTRALKRKGQGQVQLAHLGDADDAAVETVVMERPVRDRIERLLGMDFDTFGRSVLLAQNRFAEFLLASDAPRNAVLKGVFGYERFDAALAAAREHVARREATVAALDADGARLTQARAALEEARTAAADAVARRDRFEALLPRVADLDRHVAAAAEREATAATAAARVERAAAMVPDAATLDDTLAATAAAHEAAVQASAAVDDAAAARAATEAERDAATERIGDLQAFADLVAQLDTQAKAVTTTAATQTRAAHDAETAAKAAAASLEADAAASDALSSASDTVAEAVARLAEADDTLHAARHAEMAAELRGGLAANEPCPVCAQVVTVVPKAGKAAGIKAAERARAAAAKRHETDARARDRAAVAAANAAATAAAAGTERDRLAAASAAAEAAARQAEAELAATQSELVDRLGEGDPSALLEERRRSLTAAETAARAAAEAERAARDERDRSARGGGRGRDGPRAPARAPRGGMGRARGGPGADARGRRRAARFVRSAHRRSARSRRGRDVGPRRGRGRRHRGPRGAGHPPVRGGAPARSRRRPGRDGGADRRGGGRGARPRRGGDDRRRRRSRRALGDRARGARHRASAAHDLQPSRFLTWLLDEERTALGELASTHFEELTDGDYRFADDDTFRIVDRNAGGAIRDPDSLSGGETFLASLALALALADMVTRGGGRLDSFFLDEGFGSLDPEHIERAMRGIEHLVGSGGDRLVILVSHVEQMHELLEDLIVLDKDEHAGTTRILAGAAAPASPA